MDAVADEVRCISEVDRLTLLLLREQAEHAKTRCEAFWTVLQTKNGISVSDVLDLNTGVIKKA